MIKTGVVGGSGLSGAELVNLLLDHEAVDLRTVTGTSLAGQKVPGTRLTYAPFSMEALEELDLVFLAVPHGCAHPIVTDLNRRGWKGKLIDLTSDHRPGSVGARPAVYGLPEFFAAKIAKTDLCANPGCYATACLLSVLPLNHQLEHVVFDCISGYSGGGKNQGYDYQENILAYRLTDHGHLKEMSHLLASRPSFTPHVVNAFRGLMCTAHLKLKEPVGSSAELLAGYRRYYENTFTRVKKEIPSTKEVVGTPYCRIGGLCLEEGAGDRMVVVSVIDNLLKGAASQAVENLNLMFGLPPTTGLIATGHPQLEEATP